MLTNVIARLGRGPFHQFAKSRNSSMEIWLTARLLSTKNYEIFEIFVVDESAKLLHVQETAMRIKLVI